MERILTEDDWDTLLGRIVVGKCTPFLGAGINDGILSLSSEIAQELAGIHGCPFKDKSDLSRVTQVLAVEKDAMFPKEEVLRLLKEQLEKWERKVVAKDFFQSPDQPLCILADLPPAHLYDYQLRRSDDQGSWGSRKRTKTRIMPLEQIRHWKTVRFRLNVRL